jgi:hypothetical protein
VHYLIMVNLKRPLHYINKATHQNMNGKKLIGSFVNTAPDIFGAASILRDAFSPSETTLVQLSD